jgi:prevent-host-death family protein
MKTRIVEIGAFEAKNRFSELLEQVQRGAEITITKHDRPVARLVHLRLVLRLLWIAKAKFLLEATR